MKEFENRVAVVTGAGSGIGSALADAFAARGMKLALADVETKALAETETRVGEAGAECFAATVDVREGKAVQTFAEAVRDRFGSIHVVCNNAGVAVGGHSWEHTVQDYEWVMGVNFYGIVNGIRSFVPILMEQEEPAHIVNTASMAGLTGAPGFAAYYASKHAAVAISETLYFELKEACPRIGVSVLCPELVRTRIGTSGRNRPHAESASGPTTAERELFEGSLLTFTSTADLLPREIANRVVEAIETRKFYVLPPDSDPFIGVMEARFEAIQTGTNPGGEIPLAPNGK